MPPISPSRQAALRRALAVLVLSAFAATAPSVTAPATAAAPTATSDAGAATTATPATRVRIPFPADDGSLTPYTFRLGYPLLTLIYDTITWRDQRGTAEPWLARSVRTTPDGMGVVIRLRSNIRWQDGRALTSADVAFSLRYFARRFHPRFTPQLEAVQRVRTPDARTVEITLRHRAPGFRDQPLADVPILPRHRWQGLPRGAAAPTGLPLGSGPYRLVSRGRTTGYRFEANDDYFRGRPRVDTIEMPFIGDFNAMVRALTARRIDMIPLTLPEAAQGFLRRAQFKTRFGALFTGTTLMFNLRRAPFDEPAARRAVESALDLQRIARNPVIGGADAVPAVRGYLHPQSGWTTPGTVYRFELGRARAAFARLKLPQITVLAPHNDLVRREAGRQVVLALQRAGARARLQEVSASDLAAAVGQDGSPPRFQAAIWSSPPLSSYDPNFLRAEFGSERAPLNLSGYRSSAFDRLAARAAAAVDRDDRRRLVKSEIDLLARDAPVVPLFFQEGAFVFRPQIYDGWTYVEGTGILDKRSFVRALTRSPDVPPPPVPAVEQTDGGIGVLGFVALGLLAAVLLVAGLGLLGRRRGR